MEHAGESRANILYTACFYSTLALKQPKRVENVHRQRGIRKTDQAKLGEDHIWLQRSRFTRFLRRMLFFRSRPLFARSSFVRSLCSVRSPTLSGLSEGWKNTQVATKGSWRRRARYIRRFVSSLSVTVTFRRNDGCLFLLEKYRQLLLVKWKKMISIRYEARFIRLTITYSFL